MTAETAATAETGTAPSEGPVVPIGLPTLVKMAFDGKDWTSIWNVLVDRLEDNPHDAAALLDLSTLAHITGRPDDRRALQRDALALQRIYRQPAPAAGQGGVRLLAFMTAGNFLANTPLEFLLEGSDVTLDMVYVVPGLPLPQPLPDHDVAIVAITELAENQAALRDVAALVPSWPRPVINAPERIERLTRDGTFALLRSAPGVVIPITARIDRAALRRIADGAAKVEAVLDGSAFPIIARPFDSHAGEGLAKLEDRAAIETYLQERPEQDFYISPFVDYSGRDGYFRKYRVALIDGRPYACHMGVSQHWMIQVNADMYINADRRAEEAKFMEGFDHDFAVRHAVALAAIAQRIGLEYVTLDCAETQDGALLIFEAGNGMIVHAMDPPDLFPYKRIQMDKVFRAFEAMLRDACRRPPPGATAAA
jgi:glutathione synthase/RimK-type ligase-like ATP-grasp enzyme